MTTNRPTGDANPGPDFHENTTARPSGSGNPGASSSDESNRPTGDENPGPEPYGMAPHPDEHVDSEQGVDGLD